MSELSPERLVQEWLGSERAAVDAAIHADPFYVPFERLATVDGWIVWVGHPPVPDGLTLAPLPEPLLWGDPTTTIAVTLLTGADYAVRRDATTSEHASEILHRESPLAIVIPEPLHRSLDNLVMLAENAGLPVVRGALSDSEIVDRVAGFRMRRVAHAVDLGRKHDPAMSFQDRAHQAEIGGNALSLLSLHDKPERDGVEVIGDLNPALGVEIGNSPTPRLDPAMLRREIARMPSFLDGVSSWLQADSIAIGWDRAIDPGVIGEVIHTYLKAIYGAETVDLRIAFGSPGAGDAALRAMNERADRRRPAGVHIASQSGID
jgi:hypothetical protein